MVGHMQANVCLDQAALAAIVIVKAPFFLICQLPTHSPPSLIFPLPLSFIPDSDANIVGLLSSC